MVAIDKKNGATLLLLGFSVFLSAIFRHFLKKKRLKRFLILNLVQIYRSFSITGNYGRRSFSKYGIEY
jgi:hypothetical protein